MFVGSALQTLQHPIKRKVITAFEKQSPSVNGRLCLASFLLSEIRAEVPVLDVLYSLLHTSCVWSCVLQSNLLM